MFCSLKGREVTLLDCHRCDSKEIGHIKGETGAKCVHAMQKCYLKKVND